MLNSPEFSNHIRITPTKKTHFEDILYYTLEGTISESESYNDFTTSNHTQKIMQICVRTLTNLSAHVLQHKEVKILHKAHSSDTIQKTIDNIQKLFLCYSLYHNTIKHNEKIRDIYTKYTQDEILFNEKHIQRGLFLSKPDLVTHRKKFAEMYKLTDQERAIRLQFSVHPQDNYDENKTNFIKFVLGKMNN